MSDWLISILNWILSAIPLVDVLTTLIKYLRGLAKETNTQIDDKAVDFLEMVFQKMGWISADATTAAIPVMKKVAK